MLPQTGESNDLLWSATKKLVIEDYDPNWPDLFQRERALVERAMGTKLVAIKHVGSTAVPGLGAKPIVDIIAGVRRTADIETCLDGLTEACHFTPGRRFQTISIVPSGLTRHVPFSSGGTSTAS